MRYRDGEDRESDNVEDRRSEGGSGMRFPFPFPRRGGGGRRGGMRLPIPGGGGKRGGFGLITILLIVGFVLLTGGDLGSIFRNILGGDGGGMPQMPKFDPGSGGSKRTQLPDAGRRSPFDIPGMPSAGKGGDGSKQVPSDQGKRFMAQVLADTEDVWRRLFKSAGKSYSEPKLVLFKGSTRTGCGRGMAQMGPFYCPQDQKIYLDLSFYEELRRKFHAPGDFAQAYVIAHEVGHHVQTLLGIAQKVQKLKRGMVPRQANKLQVRMELQADCLAGVWAHHLPSQSSQRLEPGDIEEGLNAASAIGDDMIQRQTQGHIVPDAFTHGTSKQRVRWFKRGLEAGTMRSCDTFNSADL